MGILAGVNDKHKICYNLYMKIASSPTRDKYPLSKRKIIKKSISSWILLTFIGLILSIVVGFAADSFGIGLIPFVIALLSIFLIYFYQKWYFAVYYYDLTEDYVVIRKHPITPQEINVPYERIQDIYMDQDILDRLFGIYDVHISSATFTSGMAAHIDGLTKEPAEGLKNEMLSIVQQKIRGVHTQQPTPPQNQQPNQPQSQNQVGVSNGTNI
jgi:membrane protein YdbS with pleckstrin-like domain